MCDHSPYEDTYTDMGNYILVTRTCLGCGKVIKTWKEWKV